MKKYYIYLFSKIMTVLLLFGILYVSPAQAQSSGDNPQATNDYATTSPMTRVVTDVLYNDLIPCDNFVLSVIDLSPFGAGSTAITAENYLSFIPGSSFHNDTAYITYQVECPRSTISAVLKVFVSEYNQPLNFLSRNEECMEVMPENITFGIRQKFFTTTTAAGYIVDALSSPLVGDLNGDGKPEIVAMGVNHPFNYTEARNNPKLSISKFKKLNA